MFKYTLPLLLTLVILRSANAGPFNLQSCTEDEDCLPGAECLGILDSGELDWYCDEDSGGCYCASDDSVFSCENSDTCAVGDFCGKLSPTATVSYCISCQLKTTLQIDIPSGVCPTVIPTSKPQTDEEEGSTFLEECSEESDNECHSDLDCITESNGGETLICDYNPFFSCVCVTNREGRRCESSDTCPVNERCVKLYQSSKTGYCVPCNSTSNRVDPTPILLDGESQPCPVPSPSSEFPASTDEESHYLQGCSYREDRECKDWLTCMTETNEGDYFSCGFDYFAKGCTCLYTEDTCENSETCSLGTHCVKLFNNSKTSFCVDCASTKESIRIPTPINKTGPSAECAPKITYKDPQGDAFPTYLQTCSGIFDCSGLNDCYNLRNDGTLQDCDLTPCFCLRIRDQCNRDSDCDSGYGCFRLLPNSITSFCIPCSDTGNRDPLPYPADSGNRCNVDQEVIAKPTNPSSSSDSTTTPTSDSGNPSDAVCIGAHALAHLPKEDLLFREHFRAFVLCDLHENCATPGHIIAFEEKAMMMKTYCQLRTISCRKVMMHVNSVKISRGRKIPSFSTNFQYTTYAARYETSFEELIMTLLIRMGL